MRQIPVMNAEKIIEKMIEIFGEEGIYNPDHQPKLFAHQMNIAAWVLEKSEAEQSDIETV